MEWQVNDAFVLSNQNLKNTIFKSRIYNIQTTGHSVNLEQYLSESTLCTDIPCYLL